MASTERNKSLTEIYYEENIQLSTALLRVSDELAEARNSGRIWALLFWTVSATYWGTQTDVVWVDVTLRILAGASLAGAIWFAIRGRYKPWKRVR